METVEYLIWDEYPHHRIGSDGSVWTRRRRSGLCHYPWRQLFGTENQHGYMQFCILNKNNKPKSILCHHLVLSAFRGPRPDGLFGCHRDGNKSNNSIANLYWGTPQDNANDRIAHGNSLRGELNPRSKFTNADRNQIFNAWCCGESFRSIARRLGVAKSTISRMCRNPKWKKGEVTDAR